MEGKFFVPAFTTALLLGIHPRANMDYSPLRVRLEWSLWIGIISLRARVSCWSQQYLLELLSKLLQVF